LKLTFFSLNLAWLCIF